MICNISQQPALFQIAHIIGSYALQICACAMYVFPFRDSTETKSVANEIQFAGKNIRERGVKPHPLCKCEVHLPTWAVRHHSI